MPLNCCSSVITAPWLLLLITAEVNTASTQEDTTGVVLELLLLLYTL